MNYYPILVDRAALKQMFNIDFPEGKNFLKGEDVAPVVRHLEDSGYQAVGFLEDGMFIRYIGPQSQTP